VRMFLMGDGVQCAVAKQSTPNGYYNVARMLKSILTRGDVATWGTCTQARGLEPELYIEGITPGSMDLLGDWSMDADHILIF
jgi:uncharacterized protein involved in oxidation of intracellular sulfur